MALSGAVQSRLLTSLAAFSPSKLRNRETCGLEVADPLLDRLPGIQRALGRGPGVADEAGRSADEAQWLMAGELQAAHEQQLHEVAEVQGWAPSGRIRSSR